MPKPYSELVTQAENAVASVRDAELRRVAFERVLSDLLGGEPDSGSQRAERPSRSKAKAPRASTKTAKRKGGPQAYVEELAEDGFFKKPKPISAVKAELENRGHHIPLTSLSGPLQKLCQTKVLRRQKADGKTFSYSNW